MYQGILEVHYEWDPTTGIMIRKEVSAPSGRQLIVEARGYEENNLSTEGLIVTITTAIILIVVIRHKKRII